MENPLRYRVFYTVRQKIVTSVVVLALLAVGTVVVVRQVTTPENRSCGTPGVARPPGSDECVGVATAGDGYHFGQAHLKNVVEAIGRQNAELAADEYVTVALLLPLTSTSGGFPEKVLRELQGAFAQQYAANLGQNDQTPRIRLVLANTGNGNAHWKTAVDQLKTMTGAPHHLRGVSGIATSSIPVRSAVRELTAAGIPVVGTTITADNLANSSDDERFPGLARVVPTNGDIASALANFAEVDARKALLVQDTRTDDHYITTLKDAFSELLARSPYQQMLYTSEPDITKEGTTPNTFQRIAIHLCTTQADTVFFAGRHVQLRQFVNALGARSCQDRSYTVLTGDEGSYLGSDGKLDKKALDNGLTVRYASLAHPDAWTTRPPATGGSAAAYQEFTRMLDTVNTTGPGPIGLPGEAGSEARKAALADGQTIIAYDAMALLVRALRDATPEGSHRPRLKDVARQWPQVKGTLKVSGASGWICLDNYGNPHNKAVPVVELTRGVPRFVAVAWPEGKPPAKECMPPRRP
ncbi:hypothetical protein [Streptomyces sudanensis]|uniref:hypothetical protein n=1 Tax=Streptomyces sudanensis TaxID=436397 RepID=UPI0020CF5348|nr:hypothetical protein [Streptomyces sudanensis]MCP9957842.1 hypothetical protein [Streptomyces sudanensis]MCQ0001619.1 hypothetical protein [Streptomyces sudanensis]